MKVSILSYPNESILVILNDQNVSMTNSSKYMASLKKTVPVAQFARVKCKLTRVDHLTKSVSNPCEINNNKKNIFNNFLLQTGIFISMKLTLTT